MRKIMVEADLISEISNDLINLIPHQRAHINQLMKSGIIFNYSLALDRRKLWVILQAASVDEAKKIVQAFPISNYVQFRIYDLLFHNSNASIQPQFWLN
ncbi:MAG: hypothetical protein JW801_08430 [Bacteroidales bacterium]|nr:hypothetical protein [Bacteroidales bacterium]